MNRQFRTNVRMSKLPQPPEAQGIRPNNPRPSERDPRPGRYSIVGSFIDLSGDDPDKRKEPDA